MKKILVRAKRLWPSAEARVGLTADALAFGGLALFWLGAHAIYPPAALVGVGAALFWLGVWGAPSR